MHVLRTVYPLFRLLCKLRHETKALASWLRRQQTELHTAIIRNTELVSRGFQRHDAKTVLNVG